MLLSLVGLIELIVKVEEVAHVHGFCVVVTLDAVNTAVRQMLNLRFRFGTFGDDMVSTFLEQADWGAQQAHTS